MAGRRSSKFHQPLTFAPFADLAPRRSSVMPVTEAANDVDPPAVPVRRRVIDARELEGQRPPSFAAWVQRRRHVAAVAFFKRAIAHQIERKTK